MRGGRRRARPAALRRRARSARALRADARIAWRSAARPRTRWSRAARSSSPSPARCAGATRRPSRASSSATARRSGSSTRPHARSRSCRVQEGYLSAAGVQFLLGEGKLADEFRIAARGCDAPIVTLMLTPLRPSHFESLELGVDAKTAAVAETTVVDLFGNRTHVAFVDLRENTAPRRRALSLRRARRRARDRGPLKARALSLDGISRHRAATAPQRRAEKLRRRRRPVGLRRNADTDSQRSHPQAADCSQVACDFGRTKGAGGPREGLWEPTGPGRSLGEMQKRENRREDPAGLA